MEYLVIVSFAGFVIGLIVGKGMEASRWRRNADEIFRVYSKNMLYKVHRDSPMKD